MTGMEIVVKENEEAAIVIWRQWKIQTSSGAIRLDDSIWVTHFKNKRDGNYYLGHYDMTLEDAISDAKERNL
tara:strand:- start:318 stop:533 length:216 start_codon:yes stop_codon:yes gene_type:complete